MRVERNAGTRPASTPATTAVAAVNPNTRQSMDESNRNCSMPVAIAALAMTTSAAQSATIPPPAPPIDASSTLSVTNCRTSRLRVAPRPARKAISCRRAAPRPTRRVPTFAMATSSTSDARPMTTLISGLVWRDALGTGLAARSATT